MEFTIEDKNGNITRPFEKYADMTLEELYENMSVEEMVMCPDFPIELIVRKMKESSGEPKESLLPESFADIKTLEDDNFISHEQSMIKE